MRILALDPAARTGYAFSAVKDRVEASGVWNLGSVPESRPGRLAEYIRIANRDWQPEVIAYEVAGMGGKNWHAAQRLNELCGVIQAVALELGCQALAWHIVSWKSRAVGHGKADKLAIMRALRTYFGIETANDNEADAIGILLASQMGPPPEPKKKVVRRLRKAAKKEPRLF